MRWAQVKAKSSVGGWHNRCVTPGHGHAAGALAAPATRVEPRLSRRRLGVQATADRSDAPPDERQPHPCRARARPPAHLPPPPDSRARSRRAAAPRATAAPRLARSARPEPAAIRAPAPPAHNGGIGRGAKPPLRVTLTGRDPAGQAGTPMLDVWVAGAGMTRIGRRSESLPDLMAEAAHAALRGAGLERPDAIVVAAMNPEEFGGHRNFASYVATHMGFAETPAIRIETATSSGAAAFYAGFAQIAAGLRRAVLVVGGEKMTHLETPRVSELIGRSIDPYERSYGATMPALAGLVARALMARRGVAPRELAQVAVKNHANALRNPYAHFRRAVTIEEVLDSRMVADPLRLLHCCPISDGAAAVVLTAARAAVRVAGIGQGTDTLAIRHRDVLTSFRATRAAALAAFAMAGFGPERVDVAELHDAFTPFELISLEDLGLVPAGKAGRGTLDGATGLDGRLPVNPSGGLKARGHPLAATGLAQIVECVWQLTGRAEGRQVRARIALAQSIGGLATNNWVTLLEAA